MRYTSDTFDFADNSAEDTATGEVFMQMTAAQAGTDLPKLTSDTSEDATKGDVKPVVDDDGTLLLCRESTGECIEWPSG